MKLSKIYANNQGFKSIIFTDGLNVIYGNIEDKKDSTGKVYEHNLGKTSLVYLLDFKLLKESKKDGFFEKNSNKFSDWIFFLEIKLNDGTFLTIRRQVNPNTKVSFRRHFSKDQDFLEEKEWDYKDLSINTKKEKNAKLILETEYLNFNVTTQYHYRKFLPYLLRTQKDYNEVFQLGYFYKHTYWKPLLFALLGLDSSLIKDKYDLDSELMDNNKFIKKLSNKGSSEEVNKIKAAIEAKEGESSELRLKIDEFDFYQKEENINFDLVKNIESEISKLNKQEYSLAYNIDQIRRSLDISDTSSLNINDVEKLFTEVGIFFPKELIKDYKDVVNFTEQITKERGKYLNEELKESEDELKRVVSQLKEYNQKRTTMLSLLKEKDTFIKYKKYQDDIIKIESDIISYRSKLDNAKTIENYQKSLNDTKEKIKEVALKIKQEIEVDSVEFKEIRKIFQDIYKKAFEYTALLVLTPNSKGNVEFDTHVINKSEGLTGRGDGYTSTRVLCASFVLAILTYYSNKSFYRFAYHDGILESWGDVHKVNFIKTVRDYCSRYDLQYVISIIKSDVPSDTSSVVLSENFSIAIVTSLSNRPSRTCMSPKASCAGPSTLSANE